MSVQSVPATSSITVWSCSPGESPVRLDGVPDQLPPDNVSVLWADVPADARPEEVLDVLGPLCPDLHHEDVADLLDRDDLAKSCSSAAGLINSSFVGFASAASATPAGEQTGDLVVQMVETLVGERLLVSCWQRSRGFLGATHLDDRDPVLHEEVRRDALHVWLAAECSTAPDLLTAVVQGLLMRSRPLVATLEQDLQAWELAYHLQPEFTETDSLKRLLAKVNEIRRRLSAFENARPHGAPPRGGLAAVTAPGLDDRVDRTTTALLERCRVILEGIRASMELVSMDKMAAQAVMAESRAKRDEVFQGRLEKVTALLLVPTLIAGIFGANTALPGGGTWTGFETMVVLMLVASVAVYVFLVARRPSQSASE